MVLCFLGGYLKNVLKIGCGVMLKMLQNIIKSDIRITKEFRELLFIYLLNSLYLADSVVILLVLKVLVTNTGFISR